MCWGCPSPSFLALPRNSCSARAGQLLTLRKYSAESSYKAIEISVPLLINGNQWRQYSDEITMKQDNLIWNSCKKVSIILSKNWIDSWKTNLCEKHLLEILDNISLWEWLYQWISAWCIWNVNYWEWAFIRVESIYKIDCINNFAHSIYLIDCVRNYFLRIYHKDMGKSIHYWLLDSFYRPLLDYFSSLNLACYFSIVPCLFSMLYIQAKVFPKCIIVIYTRLTQW